MIIVISPAKTQDFSGQDFVKDHTEPDFLQDSEKLIQVLRKKSREKISDLMQVSDQIADLNYNRFQQFTTPFNPENAKQAILAFQGDVYTDIEVEKYSKVDFEFAQNHLRILSGLYGILRPLDFIQPYRLEMKIKLKNGRGKDLYQFWGERITKKINEALEQQESKHLINLASQEYFKVLTPSKINAEVITPVFKDLQKGEYKIVAFYAKRARGMMTNFMIKNKISQAEELKTFCDAGYEFNAGLSTDTEWVFIR